MANGTGMIGRGLLGAAALWMAGCSPSAAPDTAPDNPAGSAPPRDIKHVALYLPGMNQQLQIL